MFRVATIVLNYRTPQLVIDCLETLVPEVGADDRIVVVDNASGDGSADRIRAALAEREWDDVQLIESPVNGGFSAGNNLGIRSLNARAYFLLNSDTLVRPGAIQTLWDGLEADRRLGLVGPRLEEPDGTPQVSCFRLHTPASQLMSGARTSVVDWALDSWKVPLPVSGAPMEPEWISFAAVLIRREVFDSVGLLDDGFFMYFEDVDFCRRARDGGWGIRYLPSARVAHLEGGSSDVPDAARTLKRRPPYYYASRRRYFRKSYGRRGVLAANAAWTLGRGVSWVRERLGSKRPHSVEGELRDNWLGG